MSWNRKKETTRESNGYLYHTSKEGESQEVVDDLDLCEERGKGVRLM
jgi:hypothetical protein